jgi:nucleoside-diphosphate-sugar epimerase
MKLLLTGASGFLGDKIRDNCPADFEIISLSRNKLANITCDLSLQVPHLPEVDLVVHAAGKAHSVPRTTWEKQEFYNVNVIGTANLLKGLENSTLPKSLFFISTVAVYGRITGLLINEKETLSATDPYGLSKILAEQLVFDWCKKNRVVCTIVRLPLVVDNNSPGNLGEMIKGLRQGFYFNIAGGSAKKSMVLASDAAKFIFNAYEIGGIYNLTDGYHPTFFELSKYISNQIGKSTSMNLPLWLAKSMALCGDLVGKYSPLNSQKLIKITSELTFDDSKAREAFGWNPTPVLEGFTIN